MRHFKYRDLLDYLFIDIEENGVRLRLTVVETPGFGDFVNNEERHNILSGAGESR